MWAGCSSSAAGRRRCDDRGPVRGLTVGPGYSVGAFTLQLGIRGEIGWAMVQGQSSASGVQAGRGSRLLASAGVQLAVERALVYGLRGRLSAEVGATLRTVTANVEAAPAAALRGPYGLVDLGLAF